MGNMFTSVQGQDMFSSMVAGPPPMTSNNGSYRIPSDETGQSGNVFLSVNPAFSSGGSGEAGQAFSSINPAFGAPGGSSNSSPAASPFSSMVSPMSSMVAPKLPPPPPPLTDMDADVMTVNLVGVAPPVAPPPS